MEKVRSEMAKRGKSGEMLVGGELLGRGHDVFIPLVDAGIDLVAMIEKRFVAIQVKQSKLYQRRGKFTHYWQSLNKKSFDENKGKDVFYIFVLKHETEINYLVVPSLWIDKRRARATRLRIGRPVVIHTHFPCPIIHTSILKA